MRVAGRPAALRSWGLRMCPSSFMDHQRVTPLCTQNLLLLPAQRTVPFTAIRNIPIRSFSIWRPQQRLTRPATPGSRPPLRRVGPQQHDPRVVPLHVYHDGEERAEQWSDMQALGVVFLLTAGAVALLKLLQSFDIPELRAFFARFASGCQVPGSCAVPSGFPVRFCTYSH